MPDQLTSAPDLITQLRDLTKGLFFMSESDYPVEVVCFKLEANETNLEAEVKKWAGLPESAPIKTDNLPHFFRNMVKADMVGLETAEQFKTLQGFLEQHLKEVNVWLVGETEVQALVLGKISDTDYVGVKTTLIQT